MSEEVIKRCEVSELQGTCFSTLCNVIKSITVSCVAFHGSSVNEFGGPLTLQSVS